MHDKSLSLMRRFAGTVANGDVVVDVGSRDVNGCFRELFANHKYLGIDIEDGPNVDIVVPEYEYPFEDDSVANIVSGSTLEHVRHPWRWIKEVARILKPGGRLCVIVPYAYEFHEHPVDCWRVYPDGLRALFEDFGLTTLEMEMHDGRDGGTHSILGQIVLLNPSPLGDTFGVATK